MSRRVGFQGFGTPGEGGEERTTDGGGGGPFFFFFPPQPCHVTTGLVVGAARCVLVHGPAVQLRTGSGSSEASLGLLEGAQAFCFVPLLVSWITWEAGLSCCLPSSPSQLRDMEGVAGGHVGRDLRLEPVDVAAVAEQVAFQWVTSVALFVIQLQTTVLRE